MHRLHIFIVFLFLSNLLSAQNVTVAWSKRIKDSHLYPELLYADDNFTYIGTKGGYNSTTNRQAGAAKLFKLDKNNNEIFIKDLELEDKRTQVIGLFATNDKFILIKKVEDKKNLSGELSYDFVDFEGNFTGKGKVIAQATYSKKSLFTQVAVFQSGDRSKITLCLFDWNAAHTIKIKTFDSQMNELYSSEISDNTYSDLFIHKNQVSLSNSGEFYVLKKVNQLYKFSSKANHEYSINTHGKVLDHASIGLNESGDAIVAGYYAPTEFEDLAGTFALKVDAASDAVVSPVYKPFDQNTNEILSVYKKEARLRKDETTTKLLPESVTVRVGNFYYMICEFVFETMGNTVDAKGMGTSISYTHHKESMITIIDQNGDIKKSILVPKYQTALYEDIFTSACYITSGGNFYMLYNGLDEKLTGPDAGVSQIYSAWKKSSAILVKIDSDGKSTAETLYTVKGMDVITEPRTFRQFDAKTACVVAFPAKEAGPNGSVNGYNIGRIKIE